MSKPVEKPPLDEAAIRADERERIATAMFEYAAGMDAKRFPTSQVPLQKAVIEEVAKKVASGQI